MGTYCGADDKEAEDRQPMMRQSDDVSTTTPLQDHYLRLLERLTYRKGVYQADPGREEWLLKAINTAAYSAFRSCVEQGAEEEARALLTGPLG